MTNKLELYKCEVCGNVVQVMIEGAGELVCCSQPMKAVIARNSDSDEGLTEKHTPKIETDQTQTIVRIDEHPMVDTHYIMFVQTVTKDNDEICTKYFYPGSQVVMKVELENKNVKARSYCNIHGLYESDYNENCNSCGI